MCWWRVSPETGEETQKDEQEPSQEPVSSDSEDELSGVPVTEIPAGIFHGARRLTTIEIPKTVTVFGEGAFTRASNLQTVSFGAGLEATALSDDMFLNCTNLSDKITMPACIQTIGERHFKIPESRK